MQSARSRTGSFFALPLIAVVGFISPPAHAVFDIPDSCRVGSGNYDGAFQGTSSYYTCISTEGSERLALKFDGDLGSAYTDGNTTAVTFAGIEPANDGSINESRQSP